MSLTITLIMTFLALLVLKSAEIVAISWIVVFTPIIIWVATWLVFYIFLKVIITIIKLCSDKQ